MLKWTKPVVLFLNNVVTLFNTFSPVSSHQDQTLSPSSMSSMFLYPYSVKTNVPATKHCPGLAHVWLEALIVFDMALIA